MTGINYRKHSQRLEEFKRLNEPEGKGRKMYPRGGWLLFANKCCLLERHTGGSPGVVNKRDTHKRTLTKLTVERSFHLTPALSQEQGSPRAFSAISVKHLPKNDPLKAPPSKTTHHPRWLRAHSPEQAQRQLFTVTVH